MFLVDLSIGIEMDANCNRGILSYDPNVYVSLSRGVLYLAVSYPSHFLKWLPLYRTCVHLPEAVASESHAMVM